MSADLLDFFSELAKLRSYADYEAETDFDENIAVANLETAKLFNASIEKLLSEVK